MKGRRICVRIVLTVAAVVTVGCDDDDVLAQQLTQQLNIAGEYQLNVGSEQTVNDCQLPFFVVFFGIGFKPVDAFTIDEVDAMSALVDFGEGLGRFCGGTMYSRIGDTLIFTEQFDTLPLCDGSCTLLDERTITMEFLDDGSVTAQGIARYTAQDGNCGCLPLPCVQEVTVFGSRCDDCFDCVEFPG